MNLLFKLKTCLFGIALLGLASMSVLAAGLPKTGLTGSLHDIANTGCRGCHAPHNGSTSTPTTGQILNWSRSFPSATNTFGVYDSATMQNKAVELGGSALSLSTDNRMYSLLCLSCHDGVTSTFTSPMQTVNRVGSKASFAGGAFESYGLTNDHPVNMPYDPTKDTSLQAVATVTASMPLFGSTNTVQCGTCHDSHNNINTHFLRLPNTTAACTTCHL